VFYESLVQPTLCQWRRWIGVLRAWSVAATLWAFAFLPRALLKIITHVCCNVRELRDESRAWLLLDLP
jgi:hypothetical protein